MIANTTEQPPSLRRACFDLVDSAADRMLWKEGFRGPGRPVALDRTLCRARIWASTQGLLLKELAEDHRYGDLELSKAKVAIARDPKVAAHYRPHLALLARDRFDGENS
jgi:hypothetical protein